MPKFRRFDYIFSEFIASSIYSKQPQPFLISEDLFIKYNKEYKQQGLLFSMKATFVLKDHFMLSLFGVF